jgi:copper transport protein
MWSLMWPPRAARSARALVAAVVASVCLPASPAFAHAGLESSIPAPSSVLTESPPDIVLDFDEPVEAGLSSIEVYDSNAAAIEVGEAVASAGDDSVVIASIPDLDDGVYAVVWRVASVDGHIVTGSFSFSIGVGGGAAADDLLDQLAGHAGVDRAVRRTADVARFAVYVGLILLLGVGVFAMMAPPGIAFTGARLRLMTAGWIALLFGGAIGFGAYAATAVNGSVGDMFSPSAWARVDGTSTGQWSLVRLAAAVLLGALVVRRASNRAHWWRMAAVVAGVAAIVSLPASGHPSAATPRALWVPIGAVHLGAIVIWMGGLALFSLGGRWWMSDPNGDPLVRRFSRVATVVVPIVVGTGALQTIELAGGIDELTSTTWGRSLLVKLSIVSVVIAMGAVSRWMVHNAGIASIRRIVFAEAALGVAVLAVTAGLVSQPPRAEVESRVFNTTLAQSGLIADITVTPGRVGANEVHLVLTPSGGSLTPVASVTARVSLPERELPAAPVTIAADGPNHYTGSATLPFAGDWTLEVIVEVTPGNTTLLRTVLTIP